jgi:hypothetical protein
MTYIYIYIYIVVAYIHTTGMSHLKIINGLVKFEW